MSRPGAETDDRNEELRHGIHRSLTVTRDEMETCPVAHRNHGCPAFGDAEELGSMVVGKSGLNNLAAATRALAAIESCTDLETEGHRCRPFYLMKDIFFRVARLS